MLLYRLKAWLDYRATRRNITRYWKDRLTTRLGDGGPGRVLKQKQRSHVYLASTGSGRAVVKFYIGRGKAARNGLLAHEAFELAGVRVPRILHSDLSKETRRKFGLGCVVQEFIDGAAFDLARHGELLPELGRTMAAFHGNLADWSGPHIDHSSKEGLSAHCAAAQDGHLEVLNRVGIPDAAGRCRELARWFMEWGEARPGSNLGGSSLVHGDLTPHNLIVSPGGNISVIDLDLSQRSIYGFELARAVLRIALSRDEYCGIDSLHRLWATIHERLEPLLTAYFASLPEAFRIDWIKHRDFYAAWDLFDRIASRARDVVDFKSRRLKQGYRVRDEEAHRPARAGGALMGDASPHEILLEVEARLNRLTAAIAERKPETSQPG